MNSNYCVEWTDTRGHHLCVCDTVRELKATIAIIPAGAKYAYWCMNNEIDPLK